MKDAHDGSRAAASSAAFPSGLFRPCIDALEPAVSSPMSRQEPGDGSSVLRFESNENPLGMSPRAAVAVKDAIGRGSLYPDDQCFSLRRTLAELLDLSIDQLRIGNGSSELIYLLGVATLEPGDNVVMSRYSFNLPGIVARVFGSEVRQVEMRDFHHDLDAVLDAIDAATKIVYLDLPNNPLGSGTGQKDLHRFIERIPPHVLLVCDEAYWEFADAEYVHDTIRMVKQGRNIVVLRTLSKSHGLAGLRVGYAVAPPPVVDSLTRVGMPYSVNALAQVAAEAAINDTDFVRRTVDQTNKQKAMLCDFLDRNGTPYIPSQTNFLSMDLGSAAFAIVEHLDRQGITVRSLRGYGLDSFIRVTVGTPDMNRRFVDGLEAILQILPHKGDIVETGPR